MDHAVVPEFGGIGLVSSSITSLGVTPAISLSQNEEAGAFVPAKDQATAYTPSPAVPLPPASSVSNAPNSSNPFSSAGNTSSVLNSPCLSQSGGISSTTVKPNMLPSAAEGNDDLQRRAEEARQSALEYVRRFDSPVVENNDQLQRDALLARDRALEVLSRFQSKNEQADNDHNKTETIRSTTAPDSPLPDPEFARKRAEAFDRLTARKQKAMMKNLEYVVKAQTQQMADSMDHANQLQDYKEQLENYHRSTMQVRKQRREEAKRAQSQGAGIGSKKQKQQSSATQSSSSATPSTMALYVSHLQEHSNGKVLQSLFGSYGSFRKMHYYVHKKTGKRKGDGLAIYNIPETGFATSKSRLAWMEEVCSQLNGAELPCGSILHVVPSDPLYQLRKKTDDSSSTVPDMKPTPEGSTPQDIVSSAKKESDTMGKSNNALGDETQEEDLDDFFASLD